jgi:hypothetical protein
MHVTPFESELKEEWDDFVATSRQGSFLFYRDFMEYHEDRFEDHSLMVRDDKGKLRALLPANRVNDTLHSHTGLTYGGFITANKGKTRRMMDIFEAVVAYLRKASFRILYYKSVPYIYHVTPSSEDLYALFRHDAQLTRRDVLTVIDLTQPLPYQNRRSRMVRKAQEARLSVRETDDYSTFWPILSENLRTHHDVEPVHSLDEIQLLADRFPDHIRLFAAYDDGGNMATGAVAFVSRNVCHVQYNASSRKGREVGGLDLVVDHMIDSFSGVTRYFDFGASTEEDGQVLNEGLVAYKEGFGGRTVVHDFYKIELS